MSYHSAVIESPFSPFFENQSNAIPPGFRDQFLMPYGAPYHVELQGQMLRVWHRPALLWPVFWLLAQLDTLFPEQAENVPTTVTITAHRDDQGEVYHLWQRTLKFEHIERRFTSTMRYDPDQHCIIEAQGPGQAIEIYYGLRFLSADRFTFVPMYGKLKLGKTRIRIPSWLWVSLDVTQHLDPDRDDTIHIDFELIHPWFGRIFGYKGVFTVTRVQSHD